MKKTIEEFKNQKKRIEQHNSILYCFGHIHKYHFKYFK